MAKTFEFPGFVDVHVHFRDPGATEAETTASGLEAAARGGIAAVVTMPNTSPACDSTCAIDIQRQAAQSARFDGPKPILLPSAAITRGRSGAAAADLEALAEAGAAFFTDDGAYVADSRVMAEAMARAAELNFCVAEHAVDPALLAGGVIRDCALARRLGFATMPVEAETAAIERDLALCRETGCRLHIQHISTSRGVELVRAAQREGLPVTAEATPHHLAFCCDDLGRDDANFKMAPPLGNREDRAALREAVKDGVLMFATDHAPHSAVRKAGGFAAAANGIVGLEAAVAVTWAVMVDEEGMGVEDWARAWWDKPRDIISKRCRLELENAPRTRVTVGDEYRLDAGRWASKSRNSPYDGMCVRARAELV